MKSTPWIAFLIIVLLLSVNGCGTRLSSEENLAENLAEGSVYRSSRFGVSFTVPSRWEIVEEKQREETLSLRVKDQERMASFLVITVFPATLYSKGEIVSEAEKLLRKSLYSIDEPVQHHHISLGEKSATMLKARAGQREKVVAQTVIIHGSQFTAFVTLLAREDHLDSYQETYRAILESIRLQ